MISFKLPFNYTIVVCDQGGWDLFMKKWAYGWVGNRKYPTIYIGKYKIITGPTH
jgi:hypothetical protein